jgi:hypothetical protein
MRTDNTPQSRPDEFPVYLTKREKPVHTSKLAHLNGPSDVYVATYHQDATLTEDQPDPLCLRFGQPHLTERAVGPFTGGPEREVQR